MSSRIFAFIQVESMLSHVPVIVRLKAFQFHRGKYALGTQTAVLGHRNDVYVHMWSSFVQVNLRRNHVLFTVTLLQEVIRCLKKFLRLLRGKAIKESLVRCGDETNGNYSIFRIAFGRSIRWSCLSSSCSMSLNRPTGASRNWDGSAYHQYPDSSDCPCSVHCDSRCPSWLPFSI